MEWYLLFSQQLLEIIANLKKQLQGQTAVISDLQGNVDLLQGGMQVLNQEISTQNAEMQRLQTQTAHRLRWVQCQKAKNDSLCCQPTWSALTDWKCTWRCCLHGFWVLFLFCIFLHSFKNLLLHQVYVVLASFPSNKRKITFKVFEKKYVIKWSLSLYSLFLWLI